MKTPKPTPITDKLEAELKANAAEFYQPVIRIILPKMRSLERKCR